MKLDEGFKQSEKILEKLERDIEREYSQATKELEEKVNAYFKQFARLDSKKRKLYEQGEITKEDYLEWRKNKMLIGKRWEQMRDTLANDLVRTDQIAMKYVKDRMIDVYATNMNYGTYGIEHDTRVDTSFTLYNHDAVERLIKKNPAILPFPGVDKQKDYLWNRVHIQSAITQAILQGESIDKVAKRLQRVANMDKNAAIRNARTAITGAQNGGRFDSMERAKKRGLDIKKAWMATLDGRTRDSHVALDGEERELDEEFSNKTMFPGDPEGAPGEVYNCRCRLVHVYSKYKTDWSDLSLRNTDKLGDMTYEEWKNSRKG